jgi:hypothetical protein
VSALLRWSRRHISSSQALQDASAVVLLGCAQTGRSYWTWTDDEWAGLLGRDQDRFRTAAPA